MKKKSAPVFPLVFKDQAITHLFGSIEYFGEKVIHNPSHSIQPKSFYSHRLIPEYFKLTISNPAFKLKIIPEQNWGYSIFLKKQDTMEAFMKRTFNSKKRNIFTRYVKRLETCFNIRYQLFHGEMSRTEYVFIMKALHSMIVNRFEERREVHKNLSEWNELIETTYPEILNKKASLFVIYEDDKPIEVSLNYHYDHILFSYISSYDINYSKFGLGHVEIYKQVEWCIKNQYILFEMGVGGMDYKRRWSNNVYQYRHYIIYKRYTLKLLAFILKIRLKEYLKSKKINEIVPKIKNSFKKQAKLKSNVECSEIQILKTLDTTEYQTIDTQLENYNFLNKHIHDFLYTTENHKNNITVYKHQSSALYLIVGSKNYQNISIVA